MIPGLYSCQGISIYIYEIQCTFHIHIYVRCDYSIERLRSSGVLQKLQDNALPITTRDSEESHTQATLGEILPILIILVTGFLASTICLLAEISIFRLRNNFRKQHINCSIRFVR
jgi:hypothetical protein